MRLISHCFALFVVMQIVVQDVQSRYKMLPFCFDPCTKYAQIIIDLLHLNNQNLCVEIITGLNKGSWRTVHSGHSSRGTYSCGLQSHVLVCCRISVFRFTAGNGFWQVNPLTTPRKLMALSVTEIETSADVLERPEQLYVLLFLMCISLSRSVMSICKAKDPTRPAQPACLLLHSQSQVTKREVEITSVLTLLFLTAVVNQF